MTSEHSSPNERPASPTESVTSNADANGSFLSSGTVRLAEAISKIANEGTSEDIQSYFTDLLNDTNSESLAERSAAFTILAERQKAYNNERTIAAGEAMVVAAVDSTRQGQQGIGQFTGSILTNIDAFAHNYRTGHSDALHAAMYTFTGLNDLNDHRLSWVKDQKSIGGNFTSIAHEAIQNEAVLHDAQESLQPDYSGPTIDNFGIDSATMQNVAQYLHQEVSGGRPATAVIDSLTTSQLDDIAPVRVELYDEFAKHLTDLALRIEHDTNELGLERQREALELFSNTGNTTKIGNPDLLVQNVKNLPLKLRGAFGTINGLSARLDRQLNELSEFTDDEDEDDTTTEMSSSVQHATQETDPATAPIESIAPLETPLPQPDYNLAKGMREVINPEQGSTTKPTTATPSTATSEPYVRPPKHRAGFVYGSDRFAEQDKPVPKIHRGPSQPRPVDPNAFPSPTHARRGKTPKWIQTVDEVNNRNKPQT